MFSIITLVLSHPDYIYVPIPQTFDDAERYCISQYGSHLATIMDTEDILVAISKINITYNPSPPWIGLVNVHQPPGWWRFINGEDCPYPSTGACVQNWRLHKPRNCEEGSICAVFYSQLGVVDNDKECDSRRPFLCSSV